MWPTHLTNDALRVILSYDFCQALSVTSFYFYRCLSPTRLQCTFRLTSSLVRKCLQKVICWRITFGSCGATQMMIWVRLTSDFGGKCTEGHHCTSKTQSWLSDTCSQVFSSKLRGCRAADSSHIPLHGVRPSLSRPHRNEPISEWKMGWSVSVIGSCPVSDLSYHWNANS